MMTASGTSNPMPTKHTGSRTSMQQHPSSLCKYTTRIELEDERLTFQLNFASVKPCFDQGLGCKKRKNQMAKSYVVTYWDTIEFVTWYYCCYIWCEESFDKREPFILHKESGKYCVHAIYKSISPSSLQISSYSDNTTLELSLSKALYELYTLLLSLW